MHMADALLSPAVGVATLALAGGAIAYSVVKAGKEIDDKKIPLMGVMGAFIFACQMINFSIPGTGSSGHIAGGLLLAAVLGPYAGFLTMASILLIQALVFADGGILAYGCNVINMAFFACFIAYPFIFKPITKIKNTPSFIIAASLSGGIVSLQLGAFSVTVETLLSGISELPFGTFVLFMQPIHLAIGVIEGLITGVILSFIRKTRPEILFNANAGKTTGESFSMRIVAVMGIAAIVAGGVLSWFASSNPDGLEWSIMKATKKEEIVNTGGIHGTLSSVQEKTSIFPDYSFKKGQGEGEGNGDVSWPNSDIGTSVSGIAGGIIVFALASISGIGIWIFKKRKKPEIKQGS